MSDDGACCTGLIGMGISYVIICVIIGIIAWADDTFGWEFVLSIIVAIITIIIVIALRYDKISDLGSEDDLIKGQALIEFAIVWFILIFILSLPIDIGYEGEGLIVFLLSFFLNLPGVCIFLWCGAKTLKSCETADHLSEGRKITYFGIFWLVFWLISSAIIDSVANVGWLAFILFLLLVAIPGTVAIIKIGKNVSEEGLKLKWGIEEEGRRQEEERRKIEEPYRRFLEEIQKKLYNHEIFLEEILELRKTKTSEIRKYGSEVDRMILRLKDNNNPRILMEKAQELKDKILQVEKEYYYKAFLEYFNGMPNGECKDEREKLRPRYNPHLYSENGLHRNKKWAREQTGQLDKAYNEVKNQRW